MLQRSSFFAVSVVVVGVSCALPGAALAELLWSIGVQDDSRDEFLVSVTTGSPSDSPYTFDLDADVNPDDFVKLVAGPDEDPGASIQPNDFNPLTVKYSPSCRLAAGTQPTLLVDIERLRNVVDDPPGNEDTVELQIAAGGQPVGSVLFTGVANLPGENVTPAGVGASDTYDFPIDADDFGTDLTFTVTDGWWLGFDYLSLSGECAAPGLPALGVPGSAVLAVLLVVAGLRRGLPQVGTRSPTDSPSRSSGK